MLKIRLANPSQEFIDSFPKPIEDFYLNYSKKVLEILNSKNIQSFVESSLKKEEIKNYQEFDIRIMIFPPSYDMSGMMDEDLSQISIYPIFSHGNKKEVPPCLLDFENENLVFIMITQTVQTLLHEIFHLKYLDEDEIERKSLKCVSILCNKLKYF